MKRQLTSLTALLLAVLVSACSDDSDKPRVQISCNVAAATALQACISAVNTTSGACYFSDNAACQDNNPDLLAAHSTLEDTLGSSCADGELLGLTSDAIVGRFANACQAQADSITWRTFGGPQGAVWPDASEDQRDCLEAAHGTITAFMDSSLQAMNACLADESCDIAATKETYTQEAASALESIANSCSALEDIIAVDAQSYVGNAQDQIDCTLATTHEDASALSVGCGPTNVDVMPPRGEWTQIVLDNEKWGSMCGDGSDYAIHIRPAPQGEPLDNVIVALQGGGVCLFEDDCRGRLQSSPGLFNAQDDTPLGAGLVSDDPDNPFANWTKVYLPYCNQDVFIGGGVVETLGDISLPRYGTINMRAGMRLARDIIWRYMDEAGDTGFRPDELVALFGGFSAGGYGALYNYHWVLDDLQWPRTAAFPDAGGALDNGSVAGIRSLGPLKIPAWGTRNYLPPYCFAGDCAIGPVNYAALSPRLKQVPEQQYLILSNQKDRTQQGDAFFTDEAQWIDAMRKAYCDTKDLPGIQWYLTSESINSTHVVSIRDEFYYGDVAGERMVDWFWRAVTDPDSVEDRAEEGNFTVDVPGSSPFPCELP